MSNDITTMTDDDLVMTWAGMYTRSGSDEDTLRAYRAEMTARGIWATRWERYGHIQTRNTLPTWRGRGIEPGSIIVFWDGQKITRTKPVDLSRIGLNARFRPDGGDPVPVWFGDGQIVMRIATHWVARFPLSDDEAAGLDMIATPKDVLLERIHDLIIACMHGERPLLPEPGYGESRDDAVTGTPVSRMMDQIAAWTDTARHDIVMRQRLLSMVLECNRHCAYVEVPPEVGPDGRLRMVDPDIDKACDTRRLRTMCEELSGWVSGAATNDRIRAEINRLQASSGSEFAPGAASWRDLLTDGGQPIPTADERFPDHTALTSDDIATMMMARGRKWTRQHVTKMANAHGIGKKIGRDWVFTLRDLNRFLATPDARYRDGEWVSNWDKLPDWREGA